MEEKMLLIRHCVEKGANINAVDEYVSIRTVRRIKEEKKRRENKEKKKKRKKKKK
jgi:hypothetical protein